MKFGFGILLAVLIAGSGFALQDRTAGEHKNSAKDSAGVRSAAPGDTLRKLPNKAFTAGEYLKFNVYYGPVAAGEAEMKISDVMVRNRKCYSIEFTMKTKPVFDFFYKINDRYLSNVDAEGLFPWRFEQHIREGGFERDFTADFDQVSHLATTSGGTYPIPAYVHDIMSALYFARTIDYTGFKDGQKVHLQNFYKDSTYELDVKYKGKQTIEVNAGKFNCIVIEPLAKEGGLLKGDGKLFVWITDDDRKIIVRVSTKVRVGSIDSELEEYSGLNGPLNAKVNDN